MHISVLTFCIAAIIGCVAFHFVYSRRLDRIERDRDYFFRMAERHRLKIAALKLEFDNYVNHLDFMVSERDKAKYINQLAEEVYEANAKWYKDPDTGEQLSDINIAEKIALVHSELSEALEAYRKDEWDKHLPYRPGVEVELADAVLRIFGLAVILNLDLGGAFVDKGNYNKTRQDHTLEARLAAGGKKF